MIIYKYPLSLDETLVEMPVGAKLLDVQTQRDVVYLWALVDPTKETEERTFHIYGTGHGVGDGGDYIGTAQDGPFVWHVFERRER